MRGRNAEARVYILPEHEALDGSGDPGHVTKHLDGIWNTHRLVLRVVEVGEGGVALSRK